jgi:hypothetical protein
VSSNEGLGISGASSSSEEGVKDLFGFLVISGEDSLLLLRGFY